MERNGQKLFTQKELEKHINARLMREKKKNSELLALGKIIDALVSDGVINADSYAEAGEKIRELLSSENAENTREKAEETVTVEQSAVDDFKVFEEHSGQLASCENEQETDMCGNKSRTAEKSSLCAGEMQADGGKCQCTDEKDKSAGADTDALCAMFEKLLEAFYKKSNADKVKDETEALENDDIYDKAARRAVSSTAFSASSASRAGDAGFELTPVQRSIARRAGISYREYAELLRDIPQASKIKRQLGWL